MSFTFLMCSERSGSNLTTKLFNAHPAICGPSTKHLINPVARNLFRYGKLSEPRNWNALLKDIHTLLSSDFSIWKKEFSHSELNSLVSCGEIIALLKKIFESEASEHNKHHLFIKENHLYEFLPFLLINFPDSNFIYQTRDPRDMALSWRNNKSHRGGIVHGAEQWAYDQKKFLCDYQVLRNLNKVILIKYEDLIAAPTEILRAALSFLGFDFHIEMLDFNNDHTTQLNAQKQDSWANLSQPILSNNSAKFMDELTQDEIAIIEKICYYEMKALNYKPINNKADLDKITPTSIEKLKSKEASNFPATPSPGTLKNIEAKRNFYQHEKLF